MRLEDEWKRCQKGKLPVSIVMTDLDRFKQINDTLGHEVGNDMIKRAARVIKESVRGYDVVSRYGGDEFVILLWHTTQKEADAYRERLRGLYHGMAKQLAPELQGSSISIGVATYDPSVDPLYPTDTQKLIEEADKDLFADKESRRKGPRR
jgi:diguanylate cyclase (GGDEF)-like protein